jgi:GH15 family glucan-1,4-alpha-glucosidase
VGGVVPDRYPAIEDHAVIGDLHTVALVATDGTIDWCCLPRFDSPAAFASLLDSGRGGCFAVRSEAVRTRQLYKPGTNVLVTRFLGTGSVGEVVDFMVPRHPGSPPAHPGPLLVRRLRAVRGTVDFTITCRPAFDFGRQDHAVHAPGHGGAVFTSPGVQAGLVLRASQRFSVAGPAATATITLGPGKAWTSFWSGAAGRSRRRRERPTG